MRKPTKQGGTTLGFEKEIFQAADKLRKNVDAAVYKHIVLGLIFLKFVGDRFQKRHKEIAEETSNPKSKHFIREEKQRYGVIEDRDEYTAEGVFWVPKPARWSELVKKATDPQIGKIIDDAMHAIEKENPKLKGILPKDYARAAVDPATLTGLINLFAKILDFSDNNGGNDVFGRIYEYGLREFATQEGKRGGQFYTPPHVVRLLVEMLQPFKGRVYDPCCGSGGMFVQSERFVEEHGGSKFDISIFGQESNQTTWRLCMMNLAVHGIEGDIRYNPEGSFLKDALPDLRADFVLANPPFNAKDWGQEHLKDDVRWKFGVPPAGNANFAWVQHFIHHLAPGGRAGFVLANGSLSSQSSGEGDIRKRIVESGLVECVVALPGQLFYSTQIPVCLWFLHKPLPSTSGRGEGGEGHRVRKDEVLFIDARKLGTMETRVNRTLTDEDIRKIADTFHAWRTFGSVAEGEGAHYRGGFDFAGLVNQARELRKQQTPAEAMMWELLRDRRFMGLKFRRQHQFGEYVTDFYCDEHKIVIELDGGVHSDEKQAKKDKVRDAYMQSLGLTVLRFPNSVALNNPESVLQQIASSLPSPAGRGVGGEGVAVYRDIPGFCKSATIEEIASHDYVLTPGRYVGAEANDLDDGTFEETFTRLKAELEAQFEESDRLKERIRRNLADLKP